MDTQEARRDQPSRGARASGEATDHDAPHALASSNGGRAQPSTLAHKVARGLGWFSIGLGLVEILASRRMTRLIGAKDSARSHAALRALGLREIVSGVGLLTRTPNRKWMWSRLAGDLVDLTLLRSELASSKSERGRGLAATAIVLGVAGVDGLTALQLTRERGTSGGAARRPLTVVASVTIGRPPDEVYRFWRNFANLPQALSHVESVRVDGDKSHWRAKLPVGQELEWSAQIEEDRPNELISWRSLPGGLLRNHGRVSFRTAPGQQGTELHVVLGFEPLGGAVGAALTKLLGSVPAQQLRADLKRVKQLLEIGSVMRSDASMHRGPHPAQPAAKRSANRADRESS